ncbi:M16 family metallopeptidase [Qipengyuania soli]|uniref:Insulinase family protein n=1 Tax=Qipengyuania soli TaxID=2782568 RepID=A0A7S8F5F4_9SPHN|nr:insulinase family protein [Qipengyuania soli]QPC99534.1 insulinase family protein [Qipengyuania soli]
MIIRKSLFAALLLTTSSVAHAEAVGWDPAAWELEESDIQPADGWVFGKLENGMRYIIRHNERPEGTALVRMLVHAGALDENDEERGFAHYVEHMAFNGSTNVPEGEMVKLLERLGLAFGADTNASTGFEYTEYKLDLPRADEELLGTALMLMRETASELTITPEAVERERGVVLSERRVRNTYALQNFVDGLEFTYPEGRMPARLPIGTVETLEAATATGLRRFWEREYVPSSTTLVVVGDYDPAKVEAAIRARFADWKPAVSPDQPSPGPVDPAYADAYDIYTHPALDESVTLMRHAAFVDAPDTIAARQQETLRQVASGIIGRRMSREAQKEDPPFRGAFLQLSEQDNLSRTTRLTVVTEDGGWQRGLDAAVDQYRRAMEYGFTAAEVAEQVANIRNSLENSAAQEPTRSNGGWLGAALATAQGNSVPDSAANRLAQFEAMADTISPEAVLGAMKDGWPELAAPLVRFTGKAAPEGGEGALREAVAAAYARKVDAPPQEAVTEFGYTDFGAPGKIVSDTMSERLDIRTLRFANGVMLNLKQTTLEKDRVAVQLGIDGGRLVDSKEKPLGTELFGRLAAGGLGKHSLDQLQTLLAGRSVGGNISVEDDRFAMSGNTTPKDLEFQLQVLAAFVSDPGYRAEGLGAWRQSLPAFFARLDKTPSSAFGEAMRNIVTDGDPRFSRQPLESYLALDFGSLRDAISDRLTRGAIEIAVVGDFDQQKAIDAVARTLGALPPREANFRPYDQGERQRSFTKERGLKIVRHGGEKDQALVNLMWPTADDSDWERSTRLTLLGRIVRLMVTDTLREELGKTYGSEVDTTQSEVWTGFGTFMVGAQVDVKDIAATHGALVSVIEKLRAEPVDPDLLKRALQPVLESFDNRLKSNGGWMGYVDRAQSKPEDIERFVTAKERYSAVTPEQIMETARTYLDPAEAVEFHVIPEGQ